MPALMFLRNSRVSIGFMKNARPGRKQPTLPQRAVVIRPAQSSQQNNRTLRKNVHDSDRGNYRSVTSVAGFVRFVDKPKQLRKMDELVHQSATKEETSNSTSDEDSRSRKAVLASP